MGNHSTGAPGRPAYATAVDPNYPEGSYVALRVDPLTGNLLVRGTFAPSPPASSTASSPLQQTVGSSSGQILAVNPIRLGCAVQNTGLVPVLLGLGSAPTVTAYHIALPVVNVLSGALRP